MKHAYEKILIETLNIIIEIKIALRLIFCDSENPLVFHWSHESALHFFWGTKTLHFERSPPITKSFLCFFPLFFAWPRFPHLFHWRFKTQLCWDFGRKSDISARWRSFPRVEKETHGKTINCLHPQSLTWFTWKSSYPSRGDSGFGNHHFQVLCWILGL